MPDYLPTNIPKRVSSFGDLRRISALDATPSVPVMAAASTLKANAGDLVPDALAPYQMSDDTGTEVESDGSSTLCYFDDAASINDGAGSSSSSVSSSCRVFANCEPFCCRPAKVEPQSSPHTARVRHGRTSKPVGHEHRNGVVGLGSLINGALNSTASDSPIHARLVHDEDAGLSDDNFSVALDALAGTEAEYADEVGSENGSESDVESDSGVRHGHWAASLAALEGSTDGDTEDGCESEVELDPAVRAQKHAAALAALEGHTLQRVGGMPCDMRSAPACLHPEWRADSSTAGDGIGCGVLRPAFARVCSRVSRVCHRPREISRTMYCPVLTVPADPASLPRYCRPQSRLEYLLATQPIYDSHGSRITDSGSTSAIETVREKAVRVLCDLESGILVVRGGAGGLEHVVEALDSIIEST